MSDSVFHRIIAAMNDKSAHTTIFMNEQTFAEFDVCSQTERYFDRTALQEDIDRGFRGIFLGCSVYTIDMESPFIISP